MSYYLTIAGEKVPLPKTLVPSQFAPTQTSHNLARARGYRTVYDLSDGLPDPQPLILTGIVEAAHEDALSSLLTTLRRNVRTAKAVGRYSSEVPSQSRWEAALIASSMLAVPASDCPSDALVTLTLVLAEVPDVDGLAPYW